MRLSHAIKRAGTITALAAVLVLSAAGTALANGSVVTYANSVNFTAGAGDVNDITYGWLGSNGVRIQDVVPITPGGGCTAIDAYTVRCGGSGAALTLNLGDQNDTAESYESVPNNPVINGQDGNDLLRGGDLNETINGGNGDDTIYGGNGDDLIDGGNGADTFSPQGGFDKLTYSSRMWPLVVDVGGSSSGYAGEGDLITSWDSFEMYILGSNDDQFYGAWNNVGITLAGGAGNDLLYGTNFNDSINGADGDDTIRSYDGDDTLIGGKGADDFQSGFGFDTVSYGTTLAGVHVTVDNVANDGATVPDNGRTDNVHTDVERILGSYQVDVITGQAGAPTWVESSSGNDTINLLDGSADTVNCGSGTDTVNGDLVDNVDVATCETRNLS